MHKVITWGKTVVHMVNGVGKTQPVLNYPVQNVYKPKVACKGVGKNWAGPFFPHPDKVKHQPHAEGYQVGKNCCANG